MGGFKVICTSELYSREENKPAAGGKFLEVFKCFTLRKCIFSEGIRVFQRSKSSKFSACGGLSPPRWGGKKLYSPPQGSGSWGGNSPPRGPDPGGVKILGFSFPPPSGGGKTPLTVQYQNDVIMISVISDPLPPPFVIIFLHCVFL